jgi:hypothetical protein
MRVSKEIPWSAGNASLGILLVCMIVMALLSGALALVSSVNNYSFRIKSKDIRREQALSLLPSVISDFAGFVEDEIDCPTSESVRMIEAKYERYEMALTDVSSGINELFLNDDILQNEAVKRITEEKEAKEIVSYGWIQKATAPEEMKKRLASAFNYSDSEDYFPLVNNLPLSNVNYLTERCITAFLSASDIENAQEKGTALFYRAKQNGINIAEMTDILDVKKDHKVFYLLGDKTTFWNVFYKTKGCSVSAVVCAIPDKKEDVKKIKEYRIIERSVSFD